MGSYFSEKEFILIILVVISSIIIRGVMENISIPFEYIPNFILGIVISCSFLTFYNYWIIGLICLVYFSFFSLNPALNSLFMLLLSFIARNFPIFTSYSTDTNHFILAVCCIILYSIFEQILVSFSADFYIFSINLIINILVFPIFYKIIFQIKELSNVR